MLMLLFLRKNHQLIFYGAWLLINIFQALGTELIDDEAYYWVYAQFPAWGYFDHPPMVAILIKAGYALFHNELGVRFFIILLNTATIYLLQQLTEKKNDPLFYTIAISLAAAHLGGLLAVPDVPLIFFTALFFWLYRRFLTAMTVGNSLLLGLAMALMLYSKYHGVLVIFFTLASNPKLFTKYQAYVAGLTAVLLFVPHLYWQYQHDFPSVQFHLFERSAPHYRFNYTIEYIIGQIALAGPVMGWLLLWAAFAYKPGSLTEKAMKYTVAGFYGFFLISTLKGRVEANWTVPAFTALIVLSHQYLRNVPQQAKWLYKSLPITIILVIIARIYMTSMMAEVKWLTKGDEMHNNRTWAAAVAQEAQGNPVAFINSYQKASKYWFYSGDPAMSMNGADYRRNNYNFWPLEDSFIGKKVLVAGRYHPNTLPDLVYAPDSIAAVMVDNYYSFGRVQIRMHEAPVLQRGMLTFTGEIQTPAHYLALFRQSPYDTASVHLNLHCEDSLHQNIPTSFKVNQITQERQAFQLTIPVTLKPNEYVVRLGISSCIPGIPSLNSTSFPIKVKEEAR